MTDMATLEVLREGRARITDTDHWTHGAEARDKGGASVLPECPKACKWCAVGACIATGVSGWLAAVDALDAVARGEGYSRAVDFNDHPDTTHADVLALYDAAIQAAERDRA